MPSLNLERTLLKQNYSYLQHGFDRLADNRSYATVMLSDNDARILIYRAFVEGRIRSMPKHLLPLVHAQYFRADHEEFRTRNLWSLSNAFTSAFKQLAPLKQFEVPARLGSFLKAVQDERSQPLLICQPNLWTKLKRRKLIKQR